MGCVNDHASKPKAPELSNQNNNPDKQNTTQPSSLGGPTASPHSPQSPFPHFDNFNWDPATKNASRLEINGKKVIAKNVGMPYQAVCVTPITSSCFVVFKVIKNTNSMGFGLMTENKYNDQFIGKYIQGSPDGNKFAETILYSFNNVQGKGEIFCQGIQKVNKKAELFVASGQFLMMEVDWDNWTIKFTNKKLKQSFQLPQSFRGKKFYFNGFVTQNGDSFEVI